MIAYAIVLGAARLFRLRDDQAGDNLYYMGFLFTLTSLAVSLYQFSAAGSAEQIVQNFGIAIASTIAGITLRILFNQMRRDPVEVEATARLELAEASRRVKRELEGTTLEFNYFRRMTQQSIADALDEMKEGIAAARKPLEEASRKSGATLDNLNERMVRTLEAVSEQLVQEGELLSRSAASIVEAIDAVIAKLASLQAPEQIVESKLALLVQSLTSAVNSFGESAEAQTKSMESNLKHTQTVVVAITQLLQEIQIGDVPRPSIGTRSLRNRER
jgi:archaellum component FlaC